MNFYIRFIVIISVIAGAAAIIIPKHLVPETTADVQENAVRDLIKRTVSESGAQKFNVLVDRTLAFRSFKIIKTGQDENVRIIGYDGVSVAKGFHYYLKYHLRKDVTWTNTHVDLPESAKLPNVNISSTSESSFIYYQNVCTWSYSFAWWGWSTWQRHIDWMAMMGISLSIAPIQEQIWHELYLNMGLTEIEISEHFSGPAFQAWQRMGNIRGWGGPLPAKYQRMQMLLQQKILKAQRDLGMSVALPAFAGHVPTALGRLYPNVTFSAVERWNQFPNQYCCSLFLEPNEPLFQEIANQFLRRIIDSYGSNHIYFSDPFNEIQPRLADAAYLNMTAFHIYESMRAVDPQAIWLLQGWMFVKNIFWTDELIKAFLTAVPIGQLLVLDLQSEQFPQYDRTFSYHGQPFIWCMLHNFGGTLGMHGSADLVNTRMGEARKMANSSMIGAGITPEGISQNYVMYSLALERAWVRDDLDLGAWFATYSDVRYGVEDERLRVSWQLLHKSVYSFYGLRRMRGKYTITRRPALNIDTWTWYNASTVTEAWRLLLASNASIPESNYATYEHDLVDITRQVLQVRADLLYVELMSAYKKRQLDQFTDMSDKLLAIFDDLEEILATNEHFLLGPWLESAKRLARTPVEKRLYEINARNQITAWGPQGQILDYACKQWAGLMRDYYKPRWTLFLKMMQDSLANNTKFNNTAFKEIVSKEIENPFSVAMSSYPVKGSGNTYQISQRIFAGLPTRPSSIFSSEFHKFSVMLVLP